MLRESYEHRKLFVNSSQLSRNSPVYRTFFSSFFRNSFVNFLYDSLLAPHHGLPPCRGGGAYAPMTRTIIYSEGEELTKSRPPDRNNHTTRHQSQVAGDMFGFTADHCDLWLHRGCTLGRTDMASALGRCNNLPTPKVR